MSQCIRNLLSFTLAYLRLWRAVSLWFEEYGFWNGYCRHCLWKGTIGAFIFRILNAPASIISWPTNLWFTALNSTISLFLDSLTITVVLPHSHVHPVSASSSHCFVWRYVGRFLAVPFVFPSMDASCTCSHPPPIKMHPRLLRSRVPVSLLNCKFKLQYSTSIVQPSRSSALYVDSFIAVC